MGDKNSHLSNSIKYLKHQIEQKRIMMSAKPVSLEDQRSSHGVPEKGILKSDDLPTPRKRRLSGAAKKRLNRLIENGVPYEIALERLLDEREHKIHMQMHVKSMTSTTSIVFPSTRGGSSEHKKIIHQPSTSTTRSSYKRSRSRSISPPRARRSRSPLVSRPTKTENFKVGIMHPSFPNHLIDNEQLELLQRKLMQAIEDIPDNGPQVRFQNCSFRPGWLLITCADEETRSWLRKIVQRIQPWRGCLLKAVENDELPRPQVCVVYIPDDVKGVKLSVEKVLTRLRKMNRGLLTESWKVLQCEEAGSGHIWTFSIDEISVGVLKGMNFRPYFGFGQVHFRPKSPERVDRNRDRRRSNSRGRDNERRRSSDRYNGQESSVHHRSRVEVNRTQKVRETELSLKPWLKYEPKRSDGRRHW